MSAAERIVAAIAVEHLTPAELAELMVSLAEAWPTARLYTEGRAVLAILPNPDVPPRPPRGGRPLDDSPHLRRAADDLLDRLEQRAADIGPSGGTSVLSAAGNHGVSSSAAERRRRTWRESKARARAKVRAADPARSAPKYNIDSTDCTPNVALSTTSTPVHMSTVDSSTNCGHRQVSAGVDSVDVHPSPPEPPPTLGCKNNNRPAVREARRPRLPGLEHPMPEDPTPASPDDLLRRRLTAAVPAVLARAALDAALTRGTPIRSPQAYVTGTAKRIAVAQAPAIRDAIETALTRWGPATTPTHVAEILATPAPGPKNGNHKPGPTRDELTAARQLATTWARTGLTPTEIAEGVHARYPNLTPQQIAEATAA